MSVENVVRSSGPLPLATRLVLVVALGVAVLLTAVTAAAGVPGAVAAASGTVAVSLAADAPLSASAVHGPLLSATWSSADVVVGGVPAGTAALAVVVSVADLLARAGLSAALVLLIVAVLRRSPFRALALPLTLVGGIAMIAALIAAGLGVLRDWMLAAQLDAAGAGHWPMLAAFDPQLIGAGFAVMVVGLLAGHGALLQQATDGLV